MFCGKLLIWNAVSRERVTCAAFYSQMNRLISIAAGSSNVVGIEVFPDALISLLIDEKTSKVLNYSGADSAPQTAR